MKDYAAPERAQLIANVRRLGDYQRKMYIAKLKDVLAVQDDLAHRQRLLKEEGEV